RDLHRYDLVAVLNSLPSLESEANAGLHVGDFRVSLRRPERTRRHLEADGRRPKHMREPDLHFAPEGHTGDPEVVDAVRIEDRTPTEELLRLANQKVNERSFEQNIGLAHAKRAAREEAALVAVRWVRRRGALEVPLVPRGRRDRMPRGRLHTEAENR